MADRSVSINLRARVSGFVAGMREAKGETQNLSRQMTETGASADRMRQRLEAATRALPKIKIDADSTAAEIKFAQLRSQMDSLGDKKIGIDISAADAMAQIREIESELEKLQRSETDINVRADIGTALAELRAVDAEASRLNGKDANVNVNADVGSALASIGMVAAALAALPAVTTIAVGVAALGGAFTAAGVGAAAFGAVAVPALSRINDALKAQESAAKSAGGATGGAGQSAAQAAQQALQLEQAEKRLKDAQNEERAAQEDLTRAREAGRRALEDMNFSLERSILSQKDAALAVREAEQRLAELQGDPKATALEIERAQLSLEMAQQRAREQETKTQRARKDTAAANREGVKGTKEYQDAVERLREAQDKTALAAQQLKIAQLQAQSAMSGGGGAASKLANAFDGLNKREIELAKNIKSFKDEYVAWQRSLEPDVFPVINQGLDLMRLGLREAGPLAKTASASFLTLGQDAEKALNGPFWQQFLFNLNTQMPTAIEGLGRSFINVTTGVAGIIDAFLPFTSNVVNPIENASKAFAEWGQNLKNNPQFHEFIEFVKQEAPKVWELIKNLAKALVNVGEAVLPLGVGAMSGLNLLAEIVAGMDPERLQAIALAVGAIKLASLGMGAVGAWQNLAGGITATGAAAGKAQGKMAALGKAAVGISAAVIGLEATGSIMAELGGQSEGIDKLTLALTELGQTGKWAGDLGNQWGGTFDDATKAAELFGDGLRELQDPSFGEMFWLHPLSELTAILPGIDSSVDQLEQKFADMDTALAGMVQSGNADAAAKAFEQLAAQARAQGIPIEKLQQLLPTYSQAVRVAGNASAEAAAGVDQAKLKMDGLNSSLSTFAGRTDALQALQNMKTAYNEAEKAIEAANGKLQVNATMTDKQRDAVILAREKFAAYIESVRLAADGAQTLSGKTTDGTRAVLEQLPELAKLAGKNSEAREQILLLAEAYGISRTDAEKAMGSAKGLRDMLAQLKSKELEITANTAKAEAALRSLLDKYIKPYDIPVGIRKPQAAGGINTFRAAGGIDYAAAAGLQTRPQAPGVVSKPTVLYGEGSSGSGATEAFIPYEARYRDRAVSILGQVADDFGLALYSKNAGQQITSVGSTVQASSNLLTTSLGGALDTLGATLGQSGTLTGALNGVGESATEMAQVVAVSMSGAADTVAGSIDGLTASVSTLAAATAVAKGAAATGGSRAAQQAAFEDQVRKANELLFGKKAKPAEPEKVILRPDQYGLHMGGGGVSLANTSRVSAPQQMSPLTYTTPASTAGGGAAGVPGAAAGGGTQPAVVMQGTVIQRDVDADVVTAKIAMVLDRRG
ncbi:hypothetical protein [Nonomuraea wenchangensis]|uniref:hypothetical protein n=1 Tax=Nonomuraea wenchangensis TaxID=568860 RepID=UPI003326FCC4